MRSLSSTAWLGSCLALVYGVLPAYCQDSSFISPPNPGADSTYDDNGVLSEGSLVQVKFQTNLTVFNISLVQQDTSNAPILYQNATSTEFSWTVNATGFTLNSYYEGSTLVPGNVFYFNVWDTNLGFNSHYFNITRASATQTSLTLDATATSIVPPTSAAAPTSASITSSGTTPASSSATPLPPGGLSAGSKADIGVGVTLGALAIIGAVAGAYLVGRRRQQRQQQQYQAGSQPDPRSGGASQYEGLGVVSEVDKKGLNNGWGQHQQRWTEAGGGGLGPEDRRFELAGSGGAYEVEPQARFELQSTPWHGAAPTTGSGQLG